MDSDAEDGGSVTYPIAPRTVIEACLPADGAVGLDAVYALANAAGVPDQPLRLALRRLVADGDIRQEGRGRRGSIVLTDSGVVRLQADRVGLQLALLQDRGAQPWDGTWHLYAVSVPEQERVVRDRVRRELLALGAANVSTALYVSAHDLLELLAPDTHAHLVTAAAHELTVRGEQAPQQIAEQLWPADPILAAYRELADRIDADDQTSSPEVRQLRLADALEGALRHDPLVPLELRAGAWEPSEIRSRWLQLWDTIASDEASLVFPGWLPTRRP